MPISQHEVEVSIGCVSKSQAECFCYAGNTIFRGPCYQTTAARAVLQPTSSLLNCLPPCKMNQLWHCIFMRVALHNVESPCLKLGAGAIAVCVQTSTNTHIYTHAHTHKRTYTLTHTHTRHTHANSHTHTRTRTRTRTRTEILPQATAREIYAEVASRNVTMSTIRIEIRTNFFHRFHFICA